MRRALELGRAGGYDRAGGAGGRGASVSRRRAVGAGALAAGLAVVVAACGASTGATTVGTTPVSGGTATYALAPASYANYIFPFMAGPNGLAEFTTYNVNDFQYLLYRPLYWFGKGIQPYLNPSLSLAYLPEYHGQQVSIRLKPTYKWSNGESVDAKDVVFWMNMMLSKCGPNLGRMEPAGLAQRCQQCPCSQQVHGHDDDQGRVLANLVYRQRAQPDHPDADSLGPDRFGAKPLRHGHQRLLRRLDLPRQAGAEHGELRDVTAVGGG